MCATEDLGLLKSSQSSNHTLLLICYEAIGLTVDCDECLEYSGKCLGCFETGEGNAEWDDSVEAVDPSEDAHCILVIIVCSLLDDIVGQIVADYLSVELKELLHLWRNDNEDSWKGVCLHWERVNTNIIIYILQMN